MLHSKSTDHIHHNHNYNHMPSPGAQAAIAAAVVWTLAWKGASLWRAAKNDSKPWFGVLLVSNTLGILDAIYLFGVDGARRRHERDDAVLRAAVGEPEQLGHPQET
ncbi:hypothetical protein GCM10009617_36150 [Leifsonia poae]|uniref:DUF5652 domain-containing protein n=2 Tax=Leifsonia poae TaxID=110933 RepID=A0A9W6H9R0_9MICO|nr:hypothetical protein GCM10017584_20940 [Leifsonia poae]